MLAVTTTDVLSGIAVGVLLVALTAFGLYRSLRSDREFWEQRAREDEYHRSLRPPDDEADAQP
jgi:hypothetical protein